MHPGGASYVLADRLRVDQEAVEKRDCHHLIADVTDEIRAETHPGFRFEGDQVAAEEVIEGRVGVAVDVLPEGDALRIHPDVRGDELLAGQWLIGDGERAE